jgi:Mor family transcriptional regulator
MDKHVDINNQLESLPLTGVPILLSSMIDILGVAITYRLLCDYGGRVKYVAKRPERCFIVQYAAPDQVIAFCREYGGESIEMPKKDHLERRMRNCNILDELHRGLSVSDVAHRYSLSMRQVRNIKNAGRLE